MSSKFIISNCIFGYKCSKTWDSLKATQSDDVKHCDDCDQDVFFCATPEELMNATIQGMCVAIDTKQGNKNIRLLGYPSSASIPSFLKDE